MAASASSPAAANIRGPSAASVDRRGGRRARRPDVASTSWKSPRLVTDPSPAPRAAPAGTPRTRATGSRDRRAVAVGHQGDVAGADAEAEPARRKPGERRGLRGQCQRVAGEHRDDRRAEPDPFGAGQRRRSQRGRVPAERVHDHPGGVDPGPLGPCDLLEGGGDVLQEEPEADHAAIVGRLAGLTSGREADIREDRAMLPRSTATTADDPAAAVAPPPGIGSRSSLCPASTPSSSASRPGCSGGPRTPMAVRLYEVVTCSVDGNPVATNADFAVAVSHDLGVLASADTIVVPPAGVTDDATAGVAAGAARTTPTRALDARPGRRRPATGLRPGVRLASICTAVDVLAHAGLLDGRPATTHWRHAAAFGARHPGVRLDSHVLYVDDGDVLTAAGAASGVDLCLHIVRARPRRGGGQPGGAGVRRPAAPRRWPGPVRRPPGAGVARRRRPPPPGRGRSIGSTPRWRSLTWPPTPP